MASTQTFLNSHTTQEQQEITIRNLLNIRATQKDSITHHWYTSPDYTTNTGIEYIHASAHIM